MPRGGERVGTPGKGYSQRTDLNTNRVLPITSAPSKQYGARAEIERAQQAVPMAAPVTPLDEAAAFNFPQLPPLDRPTERPSEPVTATGTLPTPVDETGEFLRALYLAYPNDDLLELLEDL